MIKRKAMAYYFLQMVNFSKALSMMIRSKARDYSRPFRAAKSEVFGTKINYNVSFDSYYIYMAYLKARVNF